MREPSPWPLLRVWHLEAMEAVIADPDAASFTRTSYVSAPAPWRALSTEALVSRVEQLLNAHYRIRWHTLNAVETGERILPFAFDFEWVHDADHPQDPTAEAAPWMLPVCERNRRLREIAFDETERLRRAARPGIASRCFEGAFELVRIDPDDSWHLVSPKDRAALCAARYGGG